MENMEKAQRTFKVEYELDWEYSVEISQLKKDLDAIENLGATHVEITADVSYDCAYITIDPVSNRIETDEEYAERIGKIEKQEEEQTQRDLSLLQKLKSKYETN